MDGKLKVEACGKKMTGCCSSPSPLPNSFCGLLVFAVTHFSFTLSLYLSLSNDSYPSQALTFPLLLTLCSSCAMLLSLCHCAPCMTTPPCVVSPAPALLVATTYCLPIQSVTEASFHFCSGYDGVLCCAVDGRENVIVHADICNICRVLKLASLPKLSHFISLQPVRTV